MHKIRNVNAVQRQATKCFGTNAKCCDCVPVSADFAQIQIKCQRVTKGHIYKACHLAECNNIRDRTGRPQCTKCRSDLTTKLQKIWL